MRFPHMFGSIIRSPLIEDLGRGMPWIETADAEHGPLDFGYLHPCPGQNSAVDAALRADTFVPCTHLHADMEPRSDFELVLAGFTAPPLSALKGPAAPAAGSVTELRQIP